MDYERKVREINGTLEDEQLEEKVSIEKKPSKKKSIPQRRIRKSDFQFRKGRSKSILHLFAFLQLLEGLILAFKCQDIQLKTF